MAWMEEKQRKEGEDRDRDDTHQGRTKKKKNRAYFLSIDGEQKEKTHDVVLTLDIGRMGSF